ncbi:hypothetical protein L6164_031328 [Bauhinia variegata]|uniref:Uncharacterized protein n=1 Tax=Bauhinia variegata TaxID=167791 RepID=A0ACB9LEL9_BAUVA|nr:hypothetical protein L6164_031328 [Bauhinia variegata]
MTKIHRASSEKKEEEGITCHGGSRHFSILVNSSASVAESGFVMVTCERLIKLKGGPPELSLLILSERKAQNRKFLYH